ncbi:AI-2E family transporter [Segetibacter koreensis]|uniref:AI-2E family transporter n=1 Tax=Segetibacter koreensis TaxID=398037 RepID=UPI000374B902|nr:AI-2E family transporter [Segetibacter koreensis]
MISKTTSTPFYTKLAMILISLIALGFIFIVGKKILSPLIFSFLFAISLLPLAGFFETKLKLPRSAASGLSVILLLLFISLILYVVGSQISDLAKDWPLFKEAFSDTINQMQNWVTVKFHIDVNKQMAYIHSETQRMLAESAGVIGATVISLSSVLLFLVFVMIDTFFLLFYRRLIIKFLVAVFTEENSTTVYDIVAQVEYIIRKYILGLLLEMGIVAAVCCVAFLLIGVKYAILLGLITGLFNIIPYIGIFTSLVLSTIITIGTAASTTKIILVIATIVAMHLVDSNILLPVIVGSKVKINALITVIGVIVGEMFWGIPGMFLSIPVIAISKVVFDRIESMKPWGMLLGDEKDEEQPPKLAEEVKSNPEIKRE